MKRGRKTNAELAALAVPDDAAEAVTPPGMKHPPTPPKHLVGVALRRFRQVAYHLHKRPEFQTVDVPTLARYCELWSLSRAVLEELERGGVMALGARGGRKPNELLRVALRYSQTLTDLEEALGITERARKRSPAAAPTTENPRGQADDGGEPFAFSIA